MRALIFSCFILLSTLAYSQCNTWLYVDSIKSGIKIGDLGITGNHITVEAEFSRTTPYDPGYYGGDVVSKHRDPPDVNYLLRPNQAAITTTNGFYEVQSSCGIVLNKTYHIALVYDGDSLKFYRNGYLLSSRAASGDLIQNSHITTIGTTAYQPTPVPSDFIGYVNEVRIWNTARTKAELNQYMNILLPNPSTQTGLIAYYTFDSLINKQGNPSWNGNLIGSASIKNVNPNCSPFIPDSCGIIISNLLYYRSVQTGNWNDINTWETSPDSTFSFGIISPALAVPDSNNAHVVTVRKGNTVTITTNGTSRQIRVNSELIVKPGVNFIAKP